MSDVVCRNCAALGHFSRECPKVICRACGRSGHMQVDCSTSSRPKRDRSVSDDEYDEEMHQPRCFNCGSLRHMRAQCPVVRGGIEMHPSNDHRCLKCGQDGHFASHCPKRSLRCFHCAEFGHQSAQCPFRTEADRICYQCHKPGHFAMNCPQIHCRSCGEIGHMQAKCPIQTSSTTCCSSCHRSGHNSDECGLMSHGHGVDVMDLAAMVPSPGSSRASTVGTTSAGPLSMNFVEDASPVPLLSSEAEAPHMPGEGAPNTGSTIPETSGVMTAEVSAALQQQQQQQQQQQNPTPPVPLLHDVVPALEVSSSAANRKGRVAVVIDGAYFERCILGFFKRDVPQHLKCKELLKYTLNLLGEIFQMHPIAYWFDTDPQCFSSFVENNYPQGHRDALLRENELRRKHLLESMNGGKELSNVVAKLVGGMKRQRGFTQEGSGHVWVQTGVDVSIATCVIECFQDRRQYQQVVLLSGDSDLYPCVHYCNQSRRGLPPEVPPVRVCGTTMTISRVFGQHQDLSDFLPRILLDEPQHNENGVVTPFPVSRFFGSRN